MFIADTTPLNYLILINQTAVLPILYGRVLIPQAVYNELQQERTPAAIKAWIANLPVWLEVREATRPFDQALGELDMGEQEAIALAETLHADLLILDDRAARTEAAKRHLNVIGTLRVLEDAAALELLDFPAVLSQLQRTTFRVSAALVQQLLDRH